MSAVNRRRVVGFLRDTDDGERRKRPNDLRDRLGDVGGQYAERRDGKLVGGERTELVVGSVLQHDFADLDLHAGGRGGNVHPAVDNLESALSGFNR